MIKTNKTINVAGKLSDDLTLGAVYLSVADLQRSIAFYQQSLGLQVHRKTDQQVHLGAGSADLIILTEKPNGVQVSNVTGLYHFALLVPSRFALAQVLKNLVETETPLQGMSDHWVSEAIYLADPDGHGIEVYRDRPRDEWDYDDNNTLKIGTTQLDLEGVWAALEQETSPWKNLPLETVMGHMHLHVRQLDEAVTFYEQVLGLDLVTTYGSQAAFLSSGGYHHHLGLNTWAGVGAPPPPDNAVGLQQFVIQIPASDIESLTARLDQAEVKYDRRDDGLFTQDPSGNGVLIRVI
ncbi:MAG: VOC family protein [Chloroflexota bacterium]